MEEKLRDADFRVYQTIRSNVWLKKNRNKYQREDNEKISDLRSGGSIMEPPALRTLGRGQPSHSAQKESAEATISSALCVLFLQ